MKKSILTLSIVTLALLACNKVNEQTEPAVEPEIIEQEGAVLSFTSDRPQTETDTKTAWDSANSAIIWTSGDRIKVGYTLDGAWMAAAGAADFSSNPKVPAKFYTSNNVTIDGTHTNLGTYSVPTNFTNSPSGDAIFYGVYPHSCTDTDSNYAPSLTISIKPSQTPGANTFDKEADIMVGQTEVQTLSGSFPTSPMEMEWNRIVAHADITFKNLGIVDDTSVDKITLTFNSEAKVVGTIYLNVTTGVVTNTSSALNSIEIKGTNLSISGSNSIEAWACVLPTAFTSVDVAVKTDKATYTRSITGISKSFKQNAHNTLGINMASATRTVNTTVLDDGNYVLAAKSGDNYYAISSAANATSTRRDRTQITTVGFDPENYNVLAPYTADNSLIWTITNVTGGVKINLVGDTDSYMQYDSNKLPLGSSGAIFDVNEVTGTYTFTTNSRYISMNGNYGFGCYESGGSYVKNIYVIPATGTPTMMFAETSKNVAADATSTTFTYTSLFLSSAPTVTITSDAGGAVSSTSIVDGTLTVNLNANVTSSPKTVELTVSATGASDVILTITQTGIVPDASNGDTLWAEAFTGFSNNAVPTASNASTTVFGSGAVAYACTNGGSTTKVYGSDHNAGGVAPELLISRENGAFAVTGIPTGNATDMTLSFKMKNGSLSISSSTPSITIGSNIGTATSPVYSITVPGGTKMIALTFTNTDGSNNTRIDDISLVAGAPVPGITVATSAATAVSSATGTTATLNGSLTLVNGALIGDVDEAGFYYKLTSAADYTQVTCASVSTTNFSYDLTGLIKDSEYTFYAYAIYDGGAEITGEPATFTPTKSSGTTETLTFSTKYAADTELDGVTVSGINISASFAKNTGSTAPKYYKSGTAVRWYGSNSMAVSAGGKTITAITINYSQKNKAVTSDVKTYTDESPGSWVGSATSVTFTVASGAGQNRISSISVTYE